MKISVWFLSFLAFVCLQILPAQAQHAQEGGARYQFKPTIVSPHHRALSRMQQQMPPVQHNVRNGAVPRGNAIFDPSILKTATPAVHPMAGVHGSLSAPRTAAQPFMSEFGRPGGEHSAQAGRLPASMPMRAAAPARSVKVAAKMQSKPRPNNVRIARAKGHPAVQTYAAGQGYVPGVVGGEIASSSQSTREVNGKIIPKGR